MNIVMIVVVIGGFLLIWPHLQGAINIGAVQTDTSGNGKAEATDKAGTITAGDGRANADDIREKTRRMIAEITAKAKSGRGMRQSNKYSSGSHNNISVSGGGARACANGRCVSGVSNVV